MFERKNAPNYWLQKDNEREGKEFSRAGGEDKITYNVDLVDTSRNKIKREQIARKRNQFDEQHHFLVVNEPFEAPTDDDKKKQLVEDDTGGKGNTGLENLKTIWKIAMNVQRQDEGENVVRKAIAYLVNVNLQIVQKRTDAWIKQNERAKLMKEKGGKL